MTDQPAEQSSPGLRPVGETPSQDSPEILPDILSRLHALEALAPAILPRLEALEKDVGPRLASLEEGLLNLAHRAEASISPEIHMAITHLYQVVLSIGGHLFGHRGNDAGATFHKLWEDTRPVALPPTGTDLSASGGSVTNEAGK